MNRGRTEFICDLTTVHSSLPDGVLGVNSSITPHIVTL